MVSNIILTKVVEIQHCGDCPNRYYEYNDLFCDKTGDQVTENGFIPENCPLPDANTVEYIKN